MADLSSLLGSAGVGGAIGKAIVNLELDTAKYQAELKAAQTETTAGANTMSSGFSKFSGAAGCLSYERFISRSMPTSTARSVRSSSQSIRTRRRCGP